MAKIRETTLIRDAAIRVLEVARRARYFRMDDLPKEISRPTIDRAIRWLRAQGAKLHFDRPNGAWKLENVDFALPSIEPTEDDIFATLVAAGTMHALKHDGAASRSRQLLVELGQRLNDKGKVPIHENALRVTMTTARVRDARWLHTLVAASRTSVVRIGYKSPWRPEPSQHVFEPWQFTLHDGVPYVRGFSRTRNEARTFAVAHISSLVRLDEVPRAPVPDDVWGDAEPRYGIDTDRPGVATVTLVDGVARWVGTQVWSDAQKDDWPKPDECLVRTIPYRSCRELARRLISVADGIVSVDPPELAAEILLLARETDRLDSKGAEREGAP